MRRLEFLSFQGLLLCTNGLRLVQASMSISVPNDSRADRIGRRKHLVDSIAGAGRVPPRTKSRNRALVEVATSATVLLLIMLAAMGLRLLLSLPQGAVR